MDISKKDFVAERALPVLLREGDEVQIKRELSARLAYIDITSDPEGVAVFHVFVDPKARDYEAIKDLPPERVAEEHPESVIRRYLGNTPVRLQDDPEHPMNHDDVLVFESAGYLSVITHFKATERRQHMVMQPAKVMER